MRMTETSFEERDYTIKSVRKWGASSSDAVLDATCTIYRVPNVDGLIGYRVEKGCAVVYGDPVCPFENLSVLAEAFYVFCKEQGYNIIYLAATQKFANWAVEHHCQTALEFGEELSLDPQKIHPAEGPKGSLIRRKVRQARDDKTLVQEYTTPNTDFEKRLEEAANTWLKFRKGPQAYISHVRLFDDRFGKRWFYATKEGAIVGLIVLNRMESEQGWHVNHLMLTPDATHGTSELLVLSVIEVLRQENCRFVSFGPVPSDQMGKIVGLGRFSEFFVRTTFKLIVKLSHLNGKKMFWSKFQPSFEPSYILLCHDRVGIKEVLSVLKALNFSF